VDNNRGAVIFDDHDLHPVIKTECRNFLGLRERCGGEESERCCHKTHKWCLPEISMKTMYAVWTGDQVA